MIDQERTEELEAVRIVALLLGEAYDKLVRKVGQS